MSKKFLILTILILLASLIAVSAQNNRQEPQDNVWLIDGNRRQFVGEDYPYQIAHQFVAVIITPVDVNGDVVTAAWTYAVINSEDEFGVLNYERAIEIVMERHPSWFADTTFGTPIRFEFATAPNDIPELEIEATVESTSSD